MYDHHSSVYNNNCLKAPSSIGSRSGSSSSNINNVDHPGIQFDQKFLNQLHNEATKNLNDKMKSDVLETAGGGGEAKTFIDFYDSIPEYDDINHLSNADFYKKLDNLKEKQREFCEYLNRQLKFDESSKLDSGWMEEYKNVNRKTKTALKQFCVTPIPKEESDKELATHKPPSRRSVRIETPSMKSSPDWTPEPFIRSKSCMKSCSDEPKTLWSDVTADDLDAVTPLPLETKSAPNSPSRTRKNKEYDGITIPKPFQMTVRDEENQIVEELFLKLNKPKHQGDKSQTPFKAHEVPVESQIPLFEKIMQDQRKRSHQTKERRKADLRAQMRPFSFTRRDEEIQELSRRFSKSLPCVYNDDVPFQAKKFKAKPIPKNLFSNYVYRKMHEDEFYRALQKKIRAEEMLKQASLPPSMAKREKSGCKFDVCPRSYKDLYAVDDAQATTRKKNKKIPNYKAFHDKYERELEELKNEFISTSPRPFKLNRTSKSSKRCKKNSYRISSAVSSSDTRTPSSLDMSSINRSNLAAVLRIQTARKRLEMEMTKKLEEAKLKEEARWREKLLRKKPVWQALTYSHEEDLAMRLQLRRDEEKLRNEEHRLRMELMLGRVNQQPTLFERQSQMTFPKTKEELMEQLHMEYAAKKSLRPKSKTSEVSDMKDEAVQVYETKGILEDNVNDLTEALREHNKEHRFFSSDEKEQCDLSSEVDK